jgi:SAM-dependent methyltransferase
MSYERFAYIYDYLMQDVPYDQWLNYVIKQKQIHSIEGKGLLDIGCGTGELTIRLLKEGFNVTGVDLSEDMLLMARQKAESAQLTLPLYCQDMSELTDLGTFDMITIFCDSINYVTDEKQIQQTFDGVYRHLDSSGIFMFDFHSIYKISQIFMNETFTLNSDHVSYIWDCFPGEESNSVEHDLTFFLQDVKSGLYERFDEFHKQRTYPILQIENWLKNSGFQIVDLSADFLDAPPNDQSERIFITCKKR